MASSSATQKGSMRQRLYGRLNRFRRKSQDSSISSREQSLSAAQVDPDTVFVPSSTPSHATHAAKSLPFDTASDFSKASTSIKNEEAQSGKGDHTGYLQHNPDDVRNLVASSDLWSAAFCEAVNSLETEIDIAILKGRNAAQLFTGLVEIDKDATQESAFLRGLQYLRSIRVPLDTMKLALDLANPLARLDPTATTVFGVVQSATAIAISLASADLEFAKQIGEMLEHISYIDDCDTLGQRANREDIHKALVSVYRKILEFYKVAFEILTRKGAKLVIKIMLEKQHVPEIVQDFLRHADILRKLVDKATWEIVEDIQIMLYDREICNWLGSEKITRQARYHADMRELRADQACEFLLANSDFTKWYHDRDTRQLVILGDMGCGKTVAMAYLVDQLSRRNEHLLPQPKICYYYCRDDGTGQAIQVLSALILALLEQLSGLKKTFYDWYKQKQAFGDPAPATDIQKLEEFLEMVVESLDRPLFIVVDGLDECDKQSQYRLLKLLERLLQKHSRLKTILSCRPDEEVLEQLNELATIALASDAKRDRVIVEHTVEKKLPFLSKDVRALVVQTLSRLAQGSAIWTRMTIELIEIRKIRALAPMQHFLKHLPLPRQLYKLYGDILSRCTSNDSRNEELALVALRFLAVSRRPLSILELAWAVALGTAQQDVTTVAALAELVDHQRVLSLIHPFITRIDFNDHGKHQIRLVHQSVKEFISDLDQDRVGDSAVQKTTDGAPSDQKNQPLESYIVEVCIRYLLLEEIEHNDLFSVEQMAIEELPQEGDVFEDNREPVQYDPHCTWEDWEKDEIRYDPTERGFGELFVYAACHWLEHFGAIKAGPFPSLTNIETLCQAGSTRLYNWTKQNCRPACTIKPRFDFDSRLYDPLGITSLYGSEAMLHHMLENSSFDKDKFLPQTAERAADQILQWWHRGRLRFLLMNDKLGHQLRTIDFFRGVIRQWSSETARHENWNLVFDVVNHISDTLIRAQWANELLCVAASAGCMPILQRLITTAQHNVQLRGELMRGIQRKPDFPSFGKSTHQSIGEAVLSNHVNVVEYLLDQEGIEAHLRHLNSHHENVLHLVSGFCNPAMVRLLVPRFQDGACQEDGQGNTPLIRIIMSSAASRDRYESAKILLLHGKVDVSSKSNEEQHNPLRVAVRLGDLDMCRLLVQVGTMDPLSALTRDHQGRMALRDEIVENEENVLAILQMLSQSANIDAGKKHHH